MTEDTFKAIPQHLQDEMRISSVEDLKFNKAYRDNEKWIEANRDVKNALKRRSSIQDNIRNDIKHK